MAASASLPTLYDHYTNGGIGQGLSTSQPFFTLNHKKITIYSGAMHYFRVPPQYWRDRLRKMRAAGLNTVETYIPWNLHEPQNGQFDFGAGGSDFQEFLDVHKFLEAAKEEDLFAIVRPGPYICTEWEFGGFPSWLLREKNIKVRTSEETYMKYVTRYFSVLLPILAMLQFTRGGPIIALQVENEYGSTERRGKFVPDRTYLQQLRQLMLGNGIAELLVTSDSPTMHGSVGTLPGVFLQTANFASNPEKEFQRLQELQFNKPVMAMEFWVGWFDHWSELHHQRNEQDFGDILERILKYPASVNMYMFHGGTSWGFLNGANLNNDLMDNSGFQPDTTSYDYDAPLTESGDYTVKYVIVKELLGRYNKILTRIPETPAITLKRKYPEVTVKGQLSLTEILSQVPNSFETYSTLPMEMFPINNQSGQSYGYVVYRKMNLKIPAYATLTISGHICDTVMVLVDGFPLNKPLTQPNDLDKFGYWRLKNSSITLTTQDLYNATLDLVVENWGRVNFGYTEQMNQFKGIWQGDVFLNDKALKNWGIFPLEFRRDWTKSLKGWHILTNRWESGPSLYIADFFADDCHDTFIDMQDWIKGVVIINGFVLGRYAGIGPQQTLYLPGPFIKPGHNSIVVFEHFVPADTIKFSAKPIYRTTQNKYKRSKV